MSDPLLEEDDASTPLTAEERDGLIPSYITLRHELNEAEQANILEAEQWAFARKRDVPPTAVISVRCWNLCVPELRSCIAAKKGESKHRFRL